MKRAKTFWNQSGTCTKFFIFSLALMAFKPTHSSSLSIQNFRFYKNSKIRVGQKIREILPPNCFSQASFSPLGHWPTTENKLSKVPDKKSRTTHQIL